MRTSDIEYHADGLRLVGHLVVPDGDGTRPAVLVAHEGPGLDDNTKAKARALAALGYVAFALDYQGDGQPKTNRDEMMARLIGLMGAPERTRELAQAGLGILLAQPETDPTRVAAIGYCFGGTMALELARSGADLKAVVGFHSGLATSRPSDAGAIRAKVLVCIGTEDPLVPPEQRVAFEAEMRAAGIDWRMNLYGGVKHSFTNPNASLAGMPGVEYHEPTDRRSWAAMRDLFAEVF